MFRVGFLGFLATFVLLLLPSDSLNNGKSALDEYHSVTDGKIFVSGATMKEKASSTMAIRLCNEMRNGRADLLEMPSNVIYDDVMQVLHRIRVTEGERFWIGGKVEGSPFTPHGYKWTNSGSYVNDTLYDINDKSCKGSYVYGIFSSGKIKLCALSDSGTNLRFICYRSVLGERLYVMPKD